MMSLLSSQLAALFPRYDFSSAGSWLQDGASNTTYRTIVASLAFELTASTATTAKIKVHPEVPKVRGADNTDTSTTTAKEASPEFVREFYFRCLSILVIGGGGKHVRYPFLIADTFGFDNIGELLDSLCATGCDTLTETLELRRELVRFLAAEVTSLRLAYRRALAEAEAYKKKARSQEDTCMEEKSAGVTAKGEEKDINGGFTHEDARFVLCLLQELSPTGTRVAEVIKISEDLINKFRAHNEHSNNNKKGDAKSTSSSSLAVTPLFPPASAVKPEHLQAVEMLHKVLVDSYALRWATQLERMQCTLKAFLDIETELYDAPISAEEAAAIGKRKGKGGASPSCALLTAEFLEMKEMLEHASGILSRFFDYPCLSIEGDLFPSSASLSTMCVGMVNTAFAPISIFLKKTNFSRRNAPLVPVPDRGGRTNVSNFDRAVSSSAKQKDSMMRQGSGGGGGGGGRGRGGGRGGGNGARHADPNKSADQVRSGGGNWSGRGGGGRGKGGNS